MRLYSPSQKSFGWVAKGFLPKAEFGSQASLQFFEGLGKGLLTSCETRPSPENTSTLNEPHWPWNVTPAYCCWADVLVQSVRWLFLLVEHFFKGEDLFFFNLAFRSAIGHPAQDGQYQGPNEGWSSFLKNHELLGCNKNASLPCFSFKDQMWLRFFAMTQVISEFSGKILHWLKRKRWIEGRELWEPWCDWGNLGKKKWDRFWCGHSWWLRSVFFKEHTSKC